MKNFFIGLLVFLSSMFTYAQTNESDSESDVDTIIDTLFGDEEEKEIEDLLQALFKEQKELEDLMTSFSDFKFLYISSNYTSDTYFAGRDIGWSGYNIRPQITFISGKGFFGGISGAYYDGGYFDPKWNFTSLNVGYGKSFGSKKTFRLSGNYSHFLYSKSGSNPLTNTISLGASLTNKRRTLGTRFSINESFGTNESLFQISWSTYFALNILNEKKYRLQLRPRLVISWAEQTAYFDSGEFEDIQEEGLLYELTIFEESEVFDLMNVQLNIPLLFSTERWDVEVGFNSNFPYEIGDENQQKTNNFFNLSIGYLLEL
ncbi:MAG: hypothetical protein ABF273_04855 [Wenyingzhuangia sp.]|uniref:hypothetical protein n=1 Tax=Wenyingzhuangia sp. TaxID=1964193 RepID=UPI00321926FA